MFLSKIWSILTIEIRWGRIAGMAVLTAFISVLTAANAFNLLPLVVFSIGGIFVERVAPNRPYWNSLFYGLMGVVFYLLLAILNVLGEGGTLPPSEVLLPEMLSIAIVVVPQSLLGTWIGVSIRRFGQLSREARARGEAESPPPEKSGAAQERDKKAARPTQTTRGRKPPRKPGS